MNLFHPFNSFESMPSHAEHSNPPPRIQYQFPLHRNEEKEEGGSISERYLTEAFEEAKLLYERKSSLSNNNNQNVDPNLLSTEEDGVKEPKGKVHLLLIERVNNISSEWLNSDQKMKFMDKLDEDEIKPNKLHSLSITKDDKTLAEFIKSILKKRKTDVSNSSESKRNKPSSSSNNNNINLNMNGQNVDPNFLLSAAEHGLISQNTTNLLLLLQYCSTLDEERFIAEFPPLNFSLEHECLTNHKVPVLDESNQLKMFPYFQKKRPAFNHCVSSGKFNRLKRTDIEMCRDNAHFGEYGYYATFFRYCGAKVIVISGFKLFDPKAQTKVEVFNKMEEMEQTSSISSPSPKLQMESEQLIDDEEMSLPKVEEVFNKMEEMEQTPSISSPPLKLPLESDQFIDDIFGNDPELLFQVKLLSLPCENFDEKEWSDTTEVPPHNLEDILPGCTLLNYVSNRSDFKREIKAFLPFVNNKDSEFGRKGYWISEIRVRTHTGEWKTIAGQAEKEEKQKIPMDLINKRMKEALRLISNLAEKNCSERDARIIQGYLNNIKFLQKATVETLHNDQAEPTSKEERMDVQEVPERQIVPRKNEGIRLVELDSRDESDTKMRRGMLYGSLVSVKRVEMDDVNKHYIESVIRFNHVNLVKIYGVSVYDDGYWVSFDEIKCNLYELLRQDERPIKKGKLVEYARDIACGLYYLHSHGLVHGDLSTKNIVEICGSKGLKLQNYSYQQFNVKRDTFDLVGVHQEEANTTTTKAEIYRYGTILYQMTTKSVLPMVEFNSVGDVEEEMIPPMESFPNRPPIFDELLAKCLKKNGRDRPLARDIAIELNNH
eukprot:TRINITY_DN3402_c0_g1_i1.p1 TRINITY_DN3402_c0_g1~~TRINITY_DN3402_c0_g1_i1.p1  ORF type:complete len:829 (+),score=236.41 TRINITY_DN3402_c0_g1_i1:59-2545(+)